MNFFKGVYKTNEDFERYNTLDFPDAREEG